jgi:hemerythrin
MTLLKWKPEFSVGDAAIDYEHEMMIQQINTLYDQLEAFADSAAIEAVLGEIHADISAHFALEERMMKQANYIEYEDHKEDHEELLDQLHEMMDVYFQSSEDREEMLKLKLSNWFGHHFATFDARLHKQLG